LAKLPLVIGYKLDKAMQLIGNGYDIVVDTTTTPYEDKKEERRGTAPVVVRQKASDGQIRLTVSYFAKSTLQ
jgi:hypothetical protein